MAGGNGAQELFRGREVGGKEEQPHRCVRRKGGWRMPARNPESEASGEGGVEKEKRCHSSSMAMEMGREREGDHLVLTVTALLSG